jgi:hypothetical protein
MTWEDLKPEQARALKAQIDRQGIYFYRLLKRLEELGFPPALLTRLRLVRQNLDLLVCLVDEFSPRRPSRFASYGSSSAGMFM